jgi:hypothetical protein
MIVDLYRKRSSRPACLMTGAAVAVAVLLGGAASSQAAHLATASACDRASSAAVSAIVGYSLPAPVGMTTTLKASPQTYNISHIHTGCTYGSFTSGGGTKKVVLLESDIDSKALTAAQVQASFKSTAKEAGAVGFKLSTYGGLGFPAYYASETADGIFFRVIVGAAGTHVFSAAVYNKTLPLSKLAALAKLAEKI